MLRQHWFSFSSRSVLALTVLVASVATACSSSPDPQQQPSPDAGVGVDSGDSGGSLHDGGGSPHDGGGNPHDASITPADSGTQHDSSTTVPDSGHAACSSIQNVAANVTANQVDESIPTAVGGSLVDGTYVLTATTYYTGAGGATGPTGKAQALTMKIAAGTFEQVVSDDGVPSTPTSGTITISGTGWTHANTCPFAISLPFTYDASPAALKLYLTGSGGKGIVATYALK